MIGYVAIAVLCVWIAFAAVLLHFGSKISINSDQSNFRTLCVISWLYTIITVAFSVYNLYSLLNIIQTKQMSTKIKLLTWLFIFINITNISLCFGMSVICSKFNREYQEKLVKHIIGLISSSFAFSLLIVIQFVVLRFFKINYGTSSKFKIGETQTLPTSYEPVELVQIIKPFPFQFCKKMNNVNEVTNESLSPTFCKLLKNQIQEVNENIEKYNALLFDGKINNELFSLIDTNFCETNSDVFDKIKIINENIIQINNAQIDNQEIGTKTADVLNDIGEVMFLLQRIFKSSIS